MTDGIQAFDYSDPFCRAQGALDEARRYAEAKHSEGAMNGLLDAFGTLLDELREMRDELEAKIDEVDSRIE